MAEYTMAVIATPPCGIMTEAEGRTTAEMYGKFQAGNAQPHVKRSHKKSRAGCTTCKQRRIKV